jgi:tetratricopeptide (TPR) repeat protein
MNAEEYSKRGDKFFGERNYDGAIADYNEVIKIEPDNPFAYYKRGLSYTNKKEFDLAIKDFNEAIRLEPDKSGEFYFYRGGAYLFKGDKAMAISDIEMAVKVNPENKSFSEALKELTFTWLVYCWGGIYCFFIRWPYLAFNTYFNKEKQNKKIGSIRNKGDTIE